MPDLCHRYLVYSHGGTLYAGFLLVREDYHFGQPVVTVEADVQQRVF